MISFRHTAASIRAAFSCAFTHRADRELNDSIRALDKVLSERTHNNPVASLIDGLVER